MINSNINNNNNNDMKYISDNIDNNGSERWLILVATFV